MHRNDRLANSREILIEVRDNMTNISLELIQENKVSKSLWTLVTNSKKKIAVGVIYAPQENVTPNNELKIMYEDIRTNKNRKRRETIIDYVLTNITSANTITEMKVDKEEQYIWIT